MADTINRRCGCKGSPEGVWVVHCGTSVVTPGNCVSTSDCKGTCDNAGKFKPNKGTDLEHNKEITMDPKVPTPRGPGEIKPKDTASGTLTEAKRLWKMKKLIKRTLLNEGPYCNGAGQDPATHTPCHRRGLGCLNMDEGYFGEMGQCVTCDPEWACVRIGGGGGNDLPLDSDGPLTRTDLQNRGSGGKAKDSIRLRESELINLIKRVINEQANWFPSQWPPTNYAFGPGGVGIQCQQCQQMSFAHGLNWQQECEGPCMHDWYDASVDCVMCIRAFGTNSGPCSDWCGTGWYNIWKPKPCYDCGGKLGDKPVPVEGYWFNGKSQGPCHELTPPLAYSPNDLDCEPKRAHDDFKHTMDDTQVLDTEPVDLGVDSPINDPGKPEKETSIELNERDLRKYYCYKCKGGFFRGTCHHHGSQLAPRGARPSDCQSLAECEDSCTRGGGRTVDTSDKRTSIELRESELVNLIKRVINEREEKPNFDSIIKQGREKGKLRGISDDEATMELNRAWSILQDNPITPDTGKKFACKGCGGGRGLCVLGGCFNGKGITWRF